jgi:hypothetical protein
MEYRIGPYCEAGTAEVQMIRLDAIIGSTDQEKFVHLVSVGGDTLTDRAEYERTILFMQSLQVLCNGLKSQGRQ